MANNDAKDIKFTGDPVAFDGVEGKRDPKTGKGRFDLIPEEVYPVIFDQIDQFNGISGRDVCYDPMLIYHNIAKENWVYAIIQMTIYGYRNERPPIDSNANCLWLCPPKEIIGCFWKMLQDLAIHFQKGAEHYGERNCQKGIPLWSFKDSALRHATQTFSGKTDEPHLISVIWNCWMAEWTVLNDESKTSSVPTTEEEIGNILEKYGLSKVCNIPDEDMQDKITAIDICINDFLATVKANEGNGPALRREFFRVFKEDILNLPNNVGFALVFKRLTEWILEPNQSGTRRLYLKYLQDYVNNLYTDDEDEIFANMDPELTVTRTDSPYDRIDGLLTDLVMSGPHNNHNKEYTTQEFINTFISDTLAGPVSLQLARRRAKERMKTYPEGSVQYSKLQTVVDALKRRINLDSYEESINK